MPPPPAAVDDDPVVDLPPIVQNELVSSGRLVEVMRDWRFATFDLSIVHLGNRHISRQVRVFKEFAVQIRPGFSAIFQPAPSH